MTGSIQPTTWGEVQAGDIVRDKNDHLWWVRWWVEVDEGRADGCGSVNLDNGRETVTIPRPAADHPVDIYVPSEAEAVNLVEAELGARILRIIEQREHTKIRALTWKVEPVAANAVALRDHIDFLHGTNVDDVLRRHKGTAANPATKKTRAENLAELREAHDACHDDPDAFPAPYPHVHSLEEAR